MTHREKIELLKDTIRHLYEKEGRSKAYIAKLLQVDRRQLTYIMNNEWKLVQAQVRHLKPSNQKFLNRHEQLIKSRLDNDITITSIAKELGVSRHYLSRTIIPASEILTQAREEYHNRRSYIKPTKFNTPIQALPKEVWKEILGYPGYKVSNLGRVKSNKVGDDAIWYELKPNINSRTGRYTIHLIKEGQRKALSLPRVVGHTFLSGHSKERNTINHINGDVSDNRASNLEWVSQSDNNTHSYKELGRPVNRGGQRYGKFKKIILNDKYEFKTIAALSRFLGKSETQTRRYIDGETKSNYKFTFIY